ncbi:MAG: heme biosynthesis protein HemY [Azoarcus sp.]|jgi:HemY protein|nr:heme biosynthesis protein HemY [Azoarcus sp.]
MRVLIWVITIFALAVGLSMLVGHDWGYVQFVAPQWYRVQMSIKLFVVLLLIGFIVAHLLTRLIQGALSLPEVVGRWRERRRRQRADRALRDALLTFHEGRYAQALKAAEKAYAASDHPATAVLLAARAAHALRDEPRYRAWMERLDGVEEKAQVARLMTEAELAINSCNFQEAAEKLETLRRDGHRHIAALRLYLRVASAQRHWEEVLKLTRQLRKHKALTEEQAQPLLRRANIERLREQVGNGEALAETWKAIPAQERDDRQLVAKAMPLFAHAGQGRLVRRTLERLLDDEWDSDLARLYACCAEEGSDCLAKGEGWLRDHPSDPGLLFALGRLCAESGLWGKAESYYAASLGQCPEIGAHLALAHLFDRLERPVDAQRHYRAAAEMAAA